MTRPNAESAGAKPTPQAALPMRAKQVLVFIAGGVLFPPVAYAAFLAVCTALMLIGKALIWLAGVFPLLFSELGVVLVMLFGIGGAVALFWYNVVYLSATERDSRDRQ